MNAPVILAAYDQADAEGMARALGYDLDDDRVSVNLPGQDLTPLAMATFGTTIEISLAAHARPDFDLVDRALAILSTRYQGHLRKRASFEVIHDARLRSVPRKPSIGTRRRHRAGVRR